MEATRTTQFARQRRGGEPSPTRGLGFVLQRKCDCGQYTGGGECEECKTKQMTLQRHSSDGATGPITVPPLVHEVLRAPGRPLDKGTQLSMEARFGHDLSAVRVHADPKAAESARAVNAHAYTVGRDVVFGEGEYDPATHAGQYLLLHELTHVIQQNGQREPGRAERIGPANSHDERIADLMARQLLQHPAPASSIRSHNSSSVLQRKGPDTDISTMDWKAGVEMAEKAAKDGKTKKAAEDYYKALIVRASQKVSAPAPLVDKKPAAADVIWKWEAAKQYSATTDPNKVDSAPNDYWKWLTFNPRAVHDDEAFTASIIFHELDHAAHARALYDEWKKAAPKTKEKWTDFYSAHYGRWAERAINVESPGVVGALAGWPEKVQPSAIEFRAYVNQFVNFFHKVSIEKQAYMAQAIVLFYPLKIQKASEKIADPALDFSQSKQQILDYFKSPPGKDKAQQEIIKIRVASEFKLAPLFRSEADSKAIRADLKEIMDYPSDSEKRKGALKAYKPEAL